MRVSKHAARSEYGAMLRDASLRDAPQHEELCACNSTRTARRGEWSRRPSYFTTIPPLSGRGTPVVAGKVSGRPLSARTAR